MEEKQVSIIAKNSILLSRNKPVALVVGAAGFIGSHLVDKLLEKNIQVIGVDNFSTGSKDNLEKAIKNKDFHFIEQSAQDFNPDIPRLDYVFISTTDGWDLISLLKKIGEKKPRYLLISSIELYEEGGKDELLKWLKQTEIKLAGFAKENGLNVRILRLGAVFGPRMHFREKDPLIKLIHEAILGNLQKEVSLQFSSRAIFVEDACSLAIKSIMAQATAQKIFDGVSTAPFKIDEAKQILLDPLWYEQKGFIQSELPPWPTPNLEKTVKFLNWKPQINLVHILKETLNSMKERGVRIGEIEQKEEKKDDLALDGEGKEALEIIKKQREEKPKIAKKRFLSSKFPVKKIYLSLSLLFIIYATAWPIFALSWGVLTFRYQLMEAEKNLEKGEFEKSLANVTQADLGVEQTRSAVESFAILRRVSFFEDKFGIADNLIKLASYSTHGAKSSILGIQFLYQAMKAVTGELNEDSSDYFINANLHLISSDENLGKAEALLKEEGFKSKLPKILQTKVESLENRLSSIHRIVQKARATSVLLPKVVSGEKEKSYLFLLQNNNELRPGGGFIGSFAKVDFGGGKLKKLAVNDIYAIDGMLNIHVEPPKEIKEDLDQKDWFLRDSNWESDFPTNAREAEWFFTKETQEKVSGTIALDVSAMEYLLEVVGPIYLSDYDETITNGNLFERAIAHSETYFFPGSQAKRNFLTSLANELLNKIFFLPKQNWPGIVSALGKSLEEKHIAVYLDDPVLFSYVASQKWASALPRVPAKISDGEVRDLLVPLEANLGANKANYYLDRSYNLDTTIGKDGEVSQRLKINYTNRSPDEVWPGGKYKNRFRLYLPFGAKITKVLWGESNITSQVTSFVDYGRSGYSMLLLLMPKEQKSLIVEYAVPGKLNFVAGLAKYRIDVIKQMGTLKDPFEWRITFPINYKAVSDEGVITPQEIRISSDLSTDRSFGVTFTK